MSICRVVKKAHPYTSIHNAVFEDRMLPFECVGVLSYLLSKPNNWKVRIGDLVRLKCGRDKIYRILNDLIKAGYVVRRRVIGEDCRVLEWVYDVYETRQESTSGFSGSGQFFSGFPDPEKPDPDFPDQENPDVSKEGGLVSNECRNNGKRNPKSFSRTSGIFSEEIAENSDVKLPVPLESEPQTVNPVITAAIAEAPGSAPVATLNPGSVTLPDPGPRPDWCALVRRHDPAAAQMLATVFEDGVSPLTHPPVARKLYKRRQAGLTGKDIELLTRFYRRTRSEDEMKPRWMVRSLFDLLSSAVLPYAIQACRETVREEIGILALTLDEEYGEHMVTYTLQYMQSSEIKTVEEMERWLRMSYHEGETPGAAHGILYLRLKCGITDTDLRTKYRDAIRKNLRYRGFITMCDRLYLDPEELFGFSRDEIKAEQDAFWAPIHEENNKMKSLL